MSKAAALAPVIAHRGASGLAPENTLAALRMAADQGASVVEVDVAISADGVCYLHHDDDLERCTDGHGRLCDQASDAIDRLNAAARHSGFPHEPVPRLTAAIDLLGERQLGLNLEIKPVAGLEEQTAMAICDVVASHWPAGLTLVLSSFSPQSLATARRRLPQVPRALISDTVPGDLDTQSDHLQLANLHCDARLIDTESLARARSAELGVYCYTVNDSAQALRLMNLGVDGIFTDHPQRMLLTLA